MWNGSITIDPFHIALCMPGQPIPHCCAIANGTSCSVRSKFLLFVICEPKAKFGVLLRVGGKEKKTTLHSMQHLFCESQS